MRRRELGFLLIAGGVLAVLVALLADPLGIGGNEGEFGWKQIALLVVGVAVAAAGATAAFMRPGERAERPDRE